jgi:sulfite oxidase
VSERIVHEHDPLNAEPRPEELCKSFITPTDQFFVRSHGTIPTIDPATYRLTVSGLVERTLSLSLDDLLRYPQRIFTATLQCAGLRRHELNTLEVVKNETPWEYGAISNAEWQGVLLGDVLNVAGVQNAARYIAFIGADEIDGHTEGLGASVSLEKAFSGEVYLVHRMNGEPLKPEHGYPLRVVTAGYIGARSVKWVTGITAQTEPSGNYYQALAYKHFAPEVREDTADWDSAPMLEDVPINSVICHPAEGEIAAGEITVRGYAICGKHGVQSVEVSPDGGKTWHRATIRESRDRWAWYLWELPLTLQRGTHELVVRATNNAGITQPESLHEVWNFKGYANNAWHRVAVTVR